MEIILRNSSSDSIIIKATSKSEVSFLNKIAHHVYKENTLGF
jgi:hypothetical protein